MRAERMLLFWSGRAWYARRVNDVGHDEVGHEVFRCDAAIGRPEPSLQQLARALVAEGFEFHQASAEDAALLALPSRSEMRAELDADTLKNVGRGNLTFAQGQARLALVRADSTNLDEMWREMRGRHGSPISAGSVKENPREAERRERGQGVAGSAPGSKRRG